MQLRKPSGPRLAKAVGLVNSGESITDACKKAKIVPSCFYTARAQGKLPEPAKLITRKPYGSQKRPQLVNVHVPMAEQDMVQVVVLKGSSAAIREIVSGMSGVFRG